MYLHGFFLFVFYLIYKEKNKNIKNVSGPHKNSNDNIIDIVEKISTRQI
jgi:hypothetical protein